MRLKTLIALLLTLLFSVSGHAFASHDLRFWQDQVASSRADLKKARAKWQVAEAKLRTVETSVAYSAKALAAIQSKIRHNEHDITIHKRQLTENKRKLKQELAALSQSLQAMNVWLNQPPLKWVLSSNDPGEFNRLLTYQRIIGQSQQALIQQLQQTQALIAKQEVVLERMHQRLLVEKGKRATNLAELKTLLAEREKTVAELKSQVLDRSEQLQDNELALNKELKSLSHRHHHQAVQKGFQKLKGHLQLPIHGQLRKVFGLSIRGSQLKWDGVVFWAPEDSLVRSVAPGRVVYADWMSGYGWLVIIDHGNGYMTLYGRNHYLYEKVGQAVRAGQVIARSGRSGGFMRPALYFSIRHNAQPLDPSDWLTRTH